MVWQRIVLLMVFGTLALPARGQAVAQPNSPVELTASAPSAAPSAEDQRLQKLAEQMAGKAVAPAPATPAASDANATPAKPKAPATDAALLAPKVDPKEKLPLGPATGAAGAAKGDAPAASNSSWLLSTLTALGLVVGLILLIRAGVAKMTGRTIASTQSPAIEVLSRTSVAPRNHVLLLRLGQRILVVGDSSAGLSTLANITDAEEVAQLLQTIAASKTGSSTHGFSQMLENFDGDYNSEPHSADQGGDGKEYRVDRARDGVKGLLSRIRSAGKAGAP